MIAKGVKSMIACPDCTNTMEQIKPNIHLCFKCGTRVEQLAFDYKDNRNLILARIRAGYATVQEAADASGYNVVYLRALEKGSHPITPKALGRLAVVYGCSISDLIDDQKEEGEREDELSRPRNGVAL